MQVLHKSKTIRAVILIFTLCCLMLAFNGCDLEELYKKMFYYNGQWIYGPDPITGEVRKIGCMYGGNQCRIDGSVDR